MKKLNEKDKKINIDSIESMNIVCIVSEKINTNSIDLQKIKENILPGSYPQIVQLPDYFHMTSSLESGDGFFRLSIVDQRIEIHIKRENNYEENFLINILSQVLDNLGEDVKKKVNAVGFNYFFKQQDSNTVNLTKMLSNKVLNSKEVKVKDVALRFFLEKDNYKFQIALIPALSIDNIKKNIILIEVNAHENIDKFNKESLQSSVIDKRNIILDYLNNILG